MTVEIMLVFGILLLVIAMFIFEWVRVDVVGIMMMVSLPLLGLVSPVEALSGLSSNAVVSIIAIIIIGAGLDKTGVMKRLARFIMRLAGKSESRVMLMVSATVAFISGFMQNIGAAALFMPATRRIALQTGVPLPKILLPMATCAIIGGTLTLVGSSPLILLNDLLTVGGKHYEPFGMFSTTPIGIMLIAVALLYFLLFGKLVLPAGKKAKKRGLLSPMLDETYHDIGEVHELTIPGGFEEKTLVELRLRSRYASTVIAVYNPTTHKRNVTPLPEAVVHAGDSLAVVGPTMFVQKMCADLGWKYSDELTLFADDLAPSEVGIMEGIVTPRSKLAGGTVHEFQMQKRYGVLPMAIFQGHDMIISDLSHLPVNEGDALLLHGKWSAFHRLKEDNDLVFTEPIEGEIERDTKAPWALLCLGVSLFSILVLNIQLSIALLLGALGMVLSKVLSIDEAYQSVDWMTVFLLAGLIPLGLAFENTGAARLIAEHIITWVGSPTPLVLLFIIAILTSFFTLFTSNVGATVLLVPLAMNTADASGFDPTVAAMTVALAASNTFILPTHQVNALIMRPGNLHAADYLKAGAGMTLIYLVVLVFGMQLVFM